MERSYEHGDERLRVSAQRDGQRLRVETARGAVEFEWQELAPGDYLLRHNGVQRRCLVARDGNDRWVWVEGRVHHLRVASPGGRDTLGPTADGLLAPMPGQIGKVLVSPGDSVVKGQLLLSMEAMKMQYDIVAPRDGIVAAVQARQGAQVASGTRLVELEPDMDGMFDAGFRANP